MTSWSLTGWATRNRRCSFLISDTDTTYNFLVALAFSQMFNLLCERADNTYGGRLPHHVRVLWDEAANTGQVPGLEKIVAVIRSREISLTLFYQAMSQCKALYKDNSETIMGNMDSIVFLGGREASTLKDISENWLGKATISMQTEGPQPGAVRELQPEPAAAWPGADDDQRDHHHAGRQVYLAAPRPAALPVPEVRPEKAPELPIYRRV